MKNYSEEAAFRSLAKKSDVRLNANSRIIQVLKGTNNNKRNYDLGLKSLAKIDFLVSQGWSKFEVEAFS